MDPVSIAGGIVAFGRLAGLLVDIYNRGFSKLEQAHEQYLEFGNAIHGLSGNIDNLEKVLHNANNELTRLRSRETPGCDLQGLDDILGDYRRTITSCEKIIQGNTDLKRDRAGFVQKVKWSTGLEAQVNRLTKRVAFHNVKMLLVLEPLRQKLFADIHARFDDVEDDLDYLINQQRKAANTQLVLERRLNVLFGLNDTTAATTPDWLGSPMFEVPPELARRFQSTLAQKKRSRGLEEQITLRKWLDAFASYFQEGRTSLDLESYLRLMKSIWIMRQVEESAEYKKTPNNSLWRRYIRRMIKKLERECEYLRQAGGTLPDPALVIHRPEDDFVISWDMGLDERPNGFEDGPSLDELLNLPLYSEDDTMRKDLRVYRNINGTLLLRSSTTSTAPNDVYTLDRETDLFLDQAHLMPFYAAPSADPRIHRLLIRNGRSGIGSEFRFVTPSDLLRFQEIVTDYKPVHHKTSVQIDTRMGNATTTQHGCMQLWQPVQAQTSTTNPTLSDRKDSILSATSPASPPSSFLSRFTTSSSSSSSIPASHLSKRSTLTSALSSPLFARPQEPSLVLILHSSTATPNSAGNIPLSLLSLTLDASTVINPRACQCHRSPNSCLYTLLERPGGLVVHSLPAQGGLEDLNLAAVGAFQKKKAPVLEGVRWVRVGFASVAERKRFEEIFERVREGFVRKVVAHREMLRGVKGVQIWEKE